MQREQSFWVWFWLALILLALAVPVRAGEREYPCAASNPAEWAVVRITSHGGSGVVVYTTNGETHVLSAAHMFESRDGSRNKPVVIDAPNPNPGASTAIQAKVVAVDHQKDLAFIKVAAGPWPYVCPIAPSGHRYTRLTSCGYDDMQWPATVRPTTPLRNEDGLRLITRERPWHGRSGGGLIDPDAGVLVGVVSALAGSNTRQEVERGGYGVYVSHYAVLRFVGWPTQQAEAPVPAYPQGTPALPPTPDGWNGQQRQVPRPQGWNVRPFAPRVSEQRQTCPPGGCPGGT